MVRKKNLCKSYIFTLWFLSVLPSFSQAFEWSGPYVGLQVGYWSAQVNYSEPYFVPDYDGRQYLYSPSFGGILGYRHQVSNFIFGVEGDAALVDDHKGPGFLSSADNYTAYDVDATAHVRGYLGYTFWETMAFIAGGVSMLSMTVDDVDPDWGRVNKAFVGWTVGGGVERPLFDHVLARIEYLYENYGTARAVISGVFPYPIENRVIAHAVRFGFSYQF